MLAVLVFDHMFHCVYETNDSLKVFKEQWLFFFHSLCCGIYGYNIFYYSTLIMAFIDHYVLLCCFKQPLNNPIIKDYFQWSLKIFGG